jgi:hypothetical protein
MIAEKELIIDASTIEFQFGYVYFFYTNKNGETKSYSIWDPDKKLFEGLWNSMLKMDATVVIPRDDGSTNLNMSIGGNKNV